MMKTRAFILLFFLFAAGCTVQLYPPVKKVEPLPPAQVEPVSVTPDGGMVMVDGDDIPQSYSGRKRFYWEQIEQSDSTQSFAVTNGAKDGRWIRGDSMRWHPNGPFVTISTDTVATRAYSRSILDGNGIFDANNIGGNIPSGMYGVVTDSLRFHDNSGSDPTSYMLNLTRDGVFPAISDMDFISIETDYDASQLAGLKSTGDILRWRNRGITQFRWYQFGNRLYLAQFDDATGTNAVNDLEMDQTEGIIIYSDTTINFRSLSTDYRFEYGIKSTSGFDSVLVVDSSNHLKKQAIADFTVGGDNWGSQVVISDSTLTGDGTSGSPLSVVSTGGSDGNGIFDATNDGGTIPASFDAQITNTFSLTDGTNNLFEINASNGHSAIGKGSSTSSQYSLNINETQSYTSSSFGGIQIANVFNHNAGSTGGMVGFFSTPSISGSFAPAYMYGGSLSPNMSGSANLTTLQGIRARPIHSGSGTVISMSAVHAQLIENGSGDVTIGYGLNVDLNTGTFENVYGVNVNDQTGSTAAYGVRTGISSGSGKYNIYASGTADNYFRGNIGIGDGNTNPGAALDIAGNMILDGIFYDKDGDAGSAGDVLTSTGSATNWVSPQYAQSYNTGGANDSITAGTPEQVISTTLGTTDTIAATSEFTVQSDADIQYTGSDNAVIKITAEAAIDPVNSVYALYYIAINGVVQNSSRFRVYGPGASIEPMSVNITFIDTDADNGDTYSLYVDQTSFINGYTVFDFRLTAEKIK